jgi:hypothetical protein
VKTTAHKPLSHCSPAVQKLFKHNQKAAALAAEGKKMKRKQERSEYWTRYLTSQTQASGQSDCSTSKPHDIKT